MKSELSLLLLNIQRLWSGAQSHTGIVGSTAPFSAYAFIYFCIQGISELGRTAKLVLLRTAIWKSANKRGKAGPCDPLYR